MRTHFLLFFFLFLTNIGCQNQRPKTEVSNQVDSLTNVYKEYYSNGRPRIEVQIINGLQNGTLKEFYENGQVKLLQDWKMGEPVGDYKLFLPNGDLVFHRRYENKVTSYGEYKAMTDIYVDTSMEFKSYDRVVIKDMREFSRAVKVFPSTKIIYGIDNEIRFQIPNIQYPSISVKNATIYAADDPQSFMIKAKDKDKNVIVLLTAQVNDTVISFEPIELTIIE